MPDDQQQRGGPPLPGGSESMERRVTRVEDALWGVWRSNGAMAELRATRKDVEALRREFRAEVESVRKGQGRVFVASVIATTASVTAILTVILAASGVGGGGG